MRVEREINLGGGHLIEIGRATWNEEELSVRNRYPTSNGGFSPHSSSELPIQDVYRIALEVLRQNLLNPTESLEIADAAVNSARHGLSQE